MDSLPNEIIEYIVTLLSYQDVMTCLKTSKIFHCLSKTTIARIRFGKHLEILEDKITKAEYSEDLSLIMEDIGLGLMPSTIREANIIEKEKAWDHVHNNKHLYFHVSGPANYRFVSMTQHTPYPRRIYLLCFGRRQLQKYSIYSHSCDVKRIRKMIVELEIQRETYAKNKNIAYTRNAYSSRS